MTRTVAFAPVLLMVATVLAGCSDSGGDGGDAGDIMPPASQRDSNGWLYGTLTGPAGPLAGGSVTVTGHSPVQAGADGTYLVPNLAPGPHNVTFAAEFHDAYVTSADIVAGAGTLQNVGLAEAFLAPGVPARHGLLVTYVDEDDHLMVAVGSQGGMTVGTEKTNDRAYYGYWKINADEGYSAAYWFVNVSWTPSETVSELGLRFFRGESLQENEIVEGTTPSYYIVGETARGDTWKTFEIMTEDLAAFGKRTWQIGVYPSTGTQEQPYGANTDYHIVITAALLSDAAPAQPPA